MTGTNFGFSTNFYYSSNFYQTNLTLTNLPSTNKVYFWSTNTNSIYPFGGTNSPGTRPKQGGAGAGGSLRVGSRSGVVQNGGALVASGGGGALQQGGLGAITILGRMQGGGQTTGVFQETYGQTTDPWLLPGGAGGGGGGGNGQPNVTLAVTYANGTAMLVWPEGMLQTAPHVNGPWTSLPTASSPYVVDATGTAFYRVVLPCE